MSNETSGAETPTKLLMGPAQKYTSRGWQLQNARHFCDWFAHEVKLHRMRSFADAVSRTIQLAIADESCTIAERLSDVLRKCDTLAFDDPAEVHAYSGLHLVDRYGRVLQVLEFLLQHGNLPLRRRALNALEVGAGPAPALFAIRDFYSCLREWSDPKEVQIAALSTFHTVERGTGWDRFLHQLSEALLEIRQGDGTQGALSFVRTVVNFSGFDTRRRHTDEIEMATQNILNEYDRAEEWISYRNARAEVERVGVSAPSAYDLIFLCNFLTQSSMTDLFRWELSRLMRSLTPGGVMVVVGGTSGQYPGVIAEIRSMARSARLVDVSPDSSLLANSDGPTRQVVANHVRSLVQAALSRCSAPRRDQLSRGLPRDLVEEGVEYTLPRFTVLALKRQTRRGGPGRTEAD